jgi:hypothetical protein
MSFLVQWFFLYWMIGTIESQKFCIWARGTLAKPEILLVAYRSDATSLDRALLKTILPSHVFGPHWRHEKESKSNVEGKRCHSSFHVIMWITVRFSTTKWSCDIILTTGHGFDLSISSRFQKFYSFYELAFNENQKVDISETYRTKRRRTL